MKEQPILNTKLKEIKRLQVQPKLMYEVAVVKNLYVSETAAVNLSKIYILKNAKKTRKPNKRGLNRDWKTNFTYDTFYGS